MTHQYDYDFVIIGSGFGGSVAACRLSEKGYSVAVIEQGARYEPKDFAKTSWDVKKFLWAPMLGLHGIFKLTAFRHVLALSGSGVGGGSLVYANTTLVPAESIWQDSQWANLQPWQQVMPAHYAAAKKMLGVTRNPYMGTADKVLQQAANEHGIGDSFYATDVAVYFGEKGQLADDPYFDGQGPKRSGCTLCGACMVGCRDGGKNTLDKNYLYFAQKQGAKILPNTQVVDVLPLHANEQGSDGYEIHTRSMQGKQQKQTLKARQVVFAGGVIGTLSLLLKLKDKGSLPHISEQLGCKVRTNSESIIGVRSKDKSINMSDGIAIGSGIYLDAHTHIEAVRYPQGSDAIGLITTLLAPGKPGALRALHWLYLVLRHPLNFLRVINPVGMARSSIILLVMQTLDGHIQMQLKRAWYWPFKKSLATVGDKIPTYIPQANSFANTIAKLINGTALTSYTEIFMNVPTTAHLLGGAAIAKDSEHGVVDRQNRVFNYQNMYICDGSMIGANLGVNPSLTICALTEHAMSHIPAKTCD